MLKKSLSLVCEAVHVSFFLNEEINTNCVILFYWCLEYCDGLIYTQEPASPEWINLLLYDNLQMDSTRLLVIVSFSHRGWLNWVWDLVMLNPYQTWRREQLPSFMRCSLLLHCWKWARIWYDILRHFRILLLLKAYDLVKLKLKESRWPMLQCMFFKESKF